MDIITQGLLGASVGYCATGKSIGRKKSLIFGAAFGCFPDSDLIWYQLFHHPYLMHRGITHSIFFAPVVALIVGFLANKKNQGRFKDWFRLAFWSLITHPLLDFFTKGGTPLLLPFSEHRFQNPGISVIDPFYSSLLGLSIIMICILTNEKTSNLINNFCLFITTSYLFLGIAQQDIALSKVKTECKKYNWDVSQCAVYVEWFSIFNRSAICKTKEGGVRVSYFSTLSSDSLTWESTFIKNSEIRIKLSNIKQLIAK